jgi:UDP-glucuronate 4-epimerase
VNGRILVTGGLGFLGSRLCATLLDEGREVVCVDDLSGEYAPAVGPPAALRLAAHGARVLSSELAGALRESETLAGVDAIVHLAGMPGVRSEQPFADVWAANAALTEAVLDAARGARVVLASTSSVYGDAVVTPTPEDAPFSPLNAYAVSKVAAEAALRRAVALDGADAVVARLFTVYGPGQRPDMAFARWIRALGRDEPLPWCAAPGTVRDFTYVDDAVAGLIAVLDRGRPGRAYNISGGRPTALDEALALLEAETGGRARLERLPSSATEARATAGSGERALAELGHRPQVSLPQGIARQVDAAGLSSEPAAARDPARPGRFPSGSGSGAAARGSGSRLAAVRPAAATFQG